MTDSGPLDGTPVTRDPQLHEELKAVWWHMASSPAFTAYITARGFNPPDEQEGWGVDYEQGPDGEDIGLVWAEPQHPHD